MIVKNLIRKCPVCSSQVGRLMHNQSFVIMEGSPLPENYDLVGCESCGFVFADTSASQEDYNIYYSLLSKYEDLNISSGSGFNQNDYDRLVRTADVVGKYIQKTDSILDIGCANGGQLKVLKERGYSNLTGVDPSKACVNNVLSSDISAFQAHLFHQSFINWDRKFDFVILSHVLEHIRDLQMVIDIIKNKLTEKGILYIEVPDASRYEKFFVVPYYFIDCEHINHFSNHSLNSLISSKGFTLIHFAQDQIKLNDSIDYPIFYSLYKLTQKDSSKVEFDNTVINSFSKFLSQSAERDKSRKIIDQLVSSQEEVIIWGAGQYALRILATSDLQKANIVAFVDSDSSKQNKKIGNINVYSPDFIKNKKSILLICSALYAEDILSSALQMNKDLEYYVLN